MERRLGLCAACRRKLLLDAESGLCVMCELEDLRERLAERDLALAQCRREKQELHWRLARLGAKEE